MIADCDNQPGINLPAQKNKKLNIPYSAVTIIKVAPATIDLLTLS